MTVADRPDVVTIPEGAFLMGCEAGQENERPVHRVWLDRFALGKFPVTNRQYREFLESTGTEPPPVLVGADVRRSAQAGGRLDLVRGGRLLPLAGNRRPANRFACPPKLNGNEPRAAGGKARFSLGR